MLHVTVFQCVIMCCDLLLLGLRVTMRCYVTICCYLRLCFAIVTMCYYALLYDDVIIAICDYVLLCVTICFYIRECVACDCVSVCDNVL